MQLSLELPTIKYTKKIADYKEELLANNSTWEGTCCLRTCSTKEFIKNCKDWRSGKNLGDACVPITEYLAVRNNDERIVGMINVRHSIAPPYIKAFGGHISYGIRPTERHKGYCVEMLHLALEECVKMGIDKVLLTCIASNTASKKCILANGGVYERTVSLPQWDDEFLKIERYWITTNQTITESKYSPKEVAPLTINY